jgi:hypothetical protein
MSGTSTLVSGAQHLSFGVMRQADTNTKESTLAAIDSMTDASLNTDTGAGIVVCLADSGGSRKAMVTVGAGGAQTAVLDVVTYDTAVCP